MGRSRTDNRSAVSPARFLRRTRTEPATDPTALFPSPFPAPAEPSPDASATAPQSFSAATAPADPQHAAHPEAPGATAYSGWTGTNSAPAQRFSPTPSSQPQSPPAPGAQPPFAPESVGGVGYGSRVNAPGDPISAAPHGSRAVPGASAARPNTELPTGRVSSTTIPLTPVGGRQASVDPSPDPSPADLGAHNAAAPFDTVPSKPTKRLWRRKPATTGEAAGREGSAAACSDESHTEPPVAVEPRGESDWRGGAEGYAAGGRTAYGHATSANDGARFDQPSAYSPSARYPQVGYPPGYFDDKVDPAVGGVGHGAAPEARAGEAFGTPPTPRSRRGETASAGNDRETGARRRGRAEGTYAGTGAWDPLGAYGIPGGFDSGRADAANAGTPHGGQDAGSRETLSGRAGRAVREALAPTGVEPEELARRLPDTLRGMGEQALVAVRKWADPRERELRRRRRTRRRSLRLGTAGGVTTVGTVGLVLISAPAWAVIVVGGGAVALVTGTAVTAKKYLQMRKEPLPQAAFVPRKMPPIRSAARASISRLIRAERALHGLGAQIARSGRLPADDLTDTLETAASGSAALHALSDDLVAMERAAEALGPRNAPLTIHVQAVAGRLDAGVVEFESMVAAAAKVLAVPESAAIADDLGWAMVHLRDAADRLDGWAQALTDLADERYRANP